MGGMKQLMKQTTVELNLPDISSWVSLSRLQQLHRGQRWDWLTAQRIVVRMNSFATVRSTKFVSNARGTKDGVVSRPPRLRIGQRCS
jgi:hypothetical protein